MLFNGGLVPTYIMYTRYLHIKNTLWALLIPSLLVSAFYVIMMRTYFNTNIPEAVSKPPGSTGRANGGSSLQSSCR